MLKYMRDGGGFLLLDEKRGARIYRHLFLFFLLNLLTLATVLAYSGITSTLLSRDVSVCYFYNATHLYCPGCGGSRSLLALLRLDFLSSFLLFPALIPSVALFLYFDFTVLFSVLRDDFSPVRRFPAKLLILIPVIILINFVIRNSLLLCGIDYISKINLTA